LLGIFCATSGATPLFLSYSITPDGGGEYTYDFTLTLDNNDGTWAAGQNFNWIIFGDGPSTPGLTNFVGDPASLPIGPFTGYTSTSGGHNGPTLLDTPDVTGGGWIPTAIGQTLTWDGTSDADLTQGELFWSNIEGSGLQASFVTATETFSDAPEPASFGLSLAALLLVGTGLFFRRRQRG